MPTEVQGYDLSGTLSRDEVEDLFAPGTLIGQGSRAYTVDDLVPGPELLGTVEDDTSLWVTFEESKKTFEVGNALHYLKDGGWRIVDADAEAYLRCSECDTLVRDGGYTHSGAFVEDADFCSEECRDRYLDAHAVPEDDTDAEAP